MTGQGDSERHWGVGKGHLLLKTGLLAITAFALSGMWIVTNPQTAHRQRPDAILFEGIAVNLVQGNGLSVDRHPPFRPEITRTPVLPLMAAGIFAVAGHHREAVLWLNALLIAAAVALGYRVARRLFEDDTAAYLGAWIVSLTPQVTGAANCFLTEPLAMFQLVLSAWLLVRWTSWQSSPRAPVIAACFGLVLASAVLNRVNFAVPAIIAGVWLSFQILRDRFRSWRAWALVVVFAICLGGPVLGWSARNASLGLSFGPMGVGKWTGYVYEIRRFRSYLLEPGEQTPQAEKEFWRHYRSPKGPTELIALDRQNRAWVERWFDDHRGRWLAAIPQRVLHLFSADRISVYRQPGSRSVRPTVHTVARWTSRAVWLFSIVGLIAVWNRKTARYLWLTTLAVQVLFSAFTACNTRYLIPFMPLLIPYSGVIIMRLWRNFFGRGLSKT